MHRGNSIVRSGLITGLVVLSSVACQPAGSPETGTGQAPDTVEQTQLPLPGSQIVPESEAGTATAGTIEPTAAVEPTTAAQPTFPEGVPPRPIAAAGIEEDFREDSPQHVAATGRPQLIEFFAFW